MKVVVAVIKDEQGRVLITRRPHTTTHGGFWEFPGGKVEPEESCELALKREIQEEVGLNITQSIFFEDIVHHYEDKKIHLFVYLVTQFEGQAQCQESQLDLRWVSIESLNDFAFPAANHKIIHRLISG